MRAEPGTRVFCTSGETKRRCFNGQSLPNDDIALLPAFPKGHVFWIRRATHRSNRINHGLVGFMSVFCNDTGQAICRQEENETPRRYSSLL